MTAARHRTGLLLTPFGLATLGCLLLALWALWFGGLLDGPIARQVRTSPVYAAPGVGLDTGAAQRIIGNRRLVVIMLEPDAHLDAGCGQVKRAAAGTLTVLVKRDGDKYDTYGCTLFTGTDTHFGNAFVAESIIGNGVDEFVGRPLDAVKVIVLNFDQLVAAGVIPGSARTISPSLPRYLLAAGAFGGVLAGSVLLYLAARRAGRVTAAHRDRRDRATDSRTVLSAAAAAVAQQIIDLDRRYATSVRPRAGNNEGFAERYRRLSAEYGQLLEEVTAADRAGEVDFTGYTRRAERLADQLRALAA